MRYFVWGIGALFGIIMVIGGITQDSAGWWIGGLVVLLAGFAFGAMAERYKRPSGR